MRCDRCGKNEATFYYKSNINGKVTQIHLCPQCAEELGYTEPPATWDDLINMLPDIQRKYLEVGLILPSNISSQVFDAGNTFVLLMLQTGQDFYNFDEASGQYVSTTFDTEAAV